MKKLTIIFLVIATIAEILLVQAALELPTVPEMTEAEVLITMMAWGFLPTFILMFLIHLANGATGDFRDRWDRELYEKYGLPPRKKHDPS